MLSTTGPQPENCKWGCQLVMLKALFTCYIIPMWLITPQIQSKHHELCVQWIATESVVLNIIKLIHLKYPRSWNWILILNIIFQRREYKMQLPPLIQRGKAKTAVKFSIHRDNKELLLYDMIERYEFWKIKYSYNDQYYR